MLEINDEKTVQIMFLMVAAQNGNITIVKDILNQGIEVDVREKGLTALMYAANEKHFNIMQFLLEKGADIEAKEHFGRTILMHASDRGDLESVKFLIEHNSNVNAIDEEGKTSLMYAANAGHAEVVEFLLGRDASINIRDENGRTALFYAQSEEHYALVEILINRGADTSIIDKNGESFETYKKSIGIISFLSAWRKGPIEINKRLLKECFLVGSQVNIAKGIISFFDDHFKNKQKGNMFYESRNEGSIRLKVIGIQNEVLNNDPRKPLKNRYWELIQIALNYQKVVSSTVESNIVMMECTIDGYYTSGIGTGVPSSNQAYRYPINQGTMEDYSSAILDKLNEHFKKLNECFKNVK